MTLKQKEYSPYLSLQTSLFFDLYAAAGVLVRPDSSWDDVKESLKVSFGAARIFDLGSAGNLTIRAEAGFVPFGDWEEMEGGLIPMSAYEAMVYGELSYTPSDAFQVSTRSVFSPVDVSGIAFLGVTWGAFQGFTTRHEGLAMFGDSDDVFGWDRDGDLAVLAIFTYKF